MALSLYFFSHTSSIIHKHKLCSRLLDSSVDGAEGICALGIAQSGAVSHSPTMVISIIAELDKRKQVATTLMQCLLHIFWIWPTRIITLGKVVVYSYTPFVFQ